MVGRRQERTTPTRSSKKTAALTPVPPPDTSSPSADGLAPPPRQQDPETQAPNTSDFPQQKQPSSIERLDSEVQALKRRTELEAALEAAHTALKDVKQSPTLPPAERLIQQRYWERQCETAKLRLELFHLPGEIKRCEQEFAFASSPVGQKLHEKRLRMQAAGRALGGGHTRWELRRSAPENPAKKAEWALIGARGNYKSKQRRLQELEAEDCEWKQQYQASLQRTASSPSPADESPANPPKPNESEDDAAADQNTATSSSSQQGSAPCESSDNAPIPLKEFKYLEDQGVFYPGIELEPGEQLRTLKRKQQLMITFLFNRLTSGKPAVHKATVLEGIESEGNDLRDAWGKSNLDIFRRLVVHDREKGFYRLNVKTD